MYYSNLYSKDYSDDNIAITVYILPKLEGWDISVYSENFVKTLGAEVEKIDGSFLSIIPKAPATKDWLAIVNDFDTDVFDISLYITEYTNSKICIDNSVDNIINKLYKETKKEYAALKKSEIRLYSYKKGSMWLSQVSPSSSFTKYNYSRLTSCLLDKAFETPKENGYLFGIVKKTIVDKRDELVDIISPISVYINCDQYDYLSNPLNLSVENEEEALLRILESIMEPKVDATLFRILYHYSKEDEKLKELYNNLLLDGYDDSLLENEDIIRMYEAYKKDVRSALKNSVDKISHIYNIVWEMQPTENLFYHLSLTSYEKNSILEADTKVLLVYCNSEYKLEEVSSIDTMLCTNYTIKRADDGRYFFIEKR